MVEIVKRLTKGSALTFEEMDGNFEKITLELNIRPTLADSSMSIINAILNIKDNVVIEGNTLAKLYELILELNTNKINKNSIVNNLASLDSTGVLSANQGKILKDTLTVETTNRINSIFSETIRATNIENTLRSDLTKETNNRILEDNVLNTKINNLLTNIDSTALNSLSELVSAFQAADSDLTNALNMLSTNGSLDLSNETSRALIAEGILQTAIIDETNARVAVLNQEEMLRISEDALKVNIVDIVDSLESNVSNVPLSANQGRVLSEGLNTSMTNLHLSLGNAVNNLVEMITQEILDRTEAINTAINTEVINRDNAIAEAITLLETRLNPI